MFDTKEIPVTLVNFNARSELNGETRSPAADISCRAKMGAEILDVLVPGLRDFLFKVPADPDLVDQTEAPAATSLRFPQINMPLKIAKELLNQKVVIDYGLGGDSNKVLAECKVHKFSVEAFEGGSVDVAWMISTHPDAEMAGWLYDNPDLKTKMQIIPPEEPQADMLAPKRQTKAEKQEAARAAAEAAFVQTGEATA